MKLKVVFTGACLSGVLLLSLLLLACGGSGKTATPPTKGSDVCGEINKAERMRYTIKYVLDSPRQANPPPDETGLEWATKPSFADFHIETNYAGTFIPPDKLDFVLSTTPGEPSVRGLRIGQNQWFQLNDRWVVQGAGGAVGQQQSGSFPFTPPLFCDAIMSPLDLAGKTATLETVGDTEANHIRIDSAPLSAAAKLFGEASDNGKLLKSYDVDLWLAKKDGRLVKVQAVANASFPYGRAMSSTLSLETSSFNDDNIADINPPTQ